MRGGIDGDDTERRRTRARKRERERAHQGWWIVLLSRGEIDGDSVRPKSLFHGRTIASVKPSPFPIPRRRDKTSDFSVGYLSDGQRVH